MAKIDAKLILDTSQAKKGIDGVKSAFKGLVAAASVQQFVSLGDEFTQITNRLKSVSSSSAEASKSFALVQKVAGETRSGLGPVADLFTDLTIATEEMGLSQEQVAGVAGTFSKALKISGADANASSGAIRQFGQALASGVLRGDEFNSIMEANPAFMRKMASALDTNVGGLRKLATEGKLTSDVMIAATQEIAGSIDEDFGKTVATVSESITNLKNNFIIFIGKIQEQTGVFTLMSDAINIVADNLNIVAAIMAGAFSAFVVGQIATVARTVITLSKAFKAAAMSGAILQGITGVGIGKMVAGLVGSGGALYLLGKAFDDGAEASGEIADELTDAEKKAKDLEGEAKKLLDAAAATADAEKEANTAKDEAARILENQLEDYKAISGELQVGREELETQLGLQNDLLTASDDQKKVIQAVADLESQRADELRDLAAKTKIDADLRLAKENEINEEYDERIKLTKQQLESQLRVNNAVETFRSAIDMLSTMQGTQANLIIERDMLTQNTKLARDRFNLEMKMMRPIIEARIKLKQDIEAAQIAELTKQQETNKKKLQLTKEEKAAIVDTFKTTQDGIDVASKNYERFRDVVLGIYDDISASSRSFGGGFREAFIDFEDTVNNAANFGKTAFDTMTQGWENAFLKFAETGKLSFKDLFKTLMTEIIKMMANKLFLALFMPGSGVFGSLFAGFFNNGGSIPAGKIGIAGENGPEIVKGPGTVISTRDSASMLGGGVTNVYYRIEATSAESFQQLVARDPEFIYNVTRVGARRTPG